MMPFSRTMPWVNNELKSKWSTWEKKARGIGKSTTLKSTMGLVPSRKGRVLFKDGVKYFYGGTGSAVAGGHSGAEKINVTCEETDGKGLSEYHVKRFSQGKDS